MLKCKRQQSVFKRFSFLFIFFCFNVFAGGLEKTVSSSVDRYTLFKDRIITERDLVNPKEHHHFLDIFLHSTSGLKSLIGEISTANNPSSSTNDRSTNINSVLARNLNTGHFINIELGGAVAVSKFQFGQQVLYPSFRFTFDVGAAMGVYSPSVSPVLLLYLKNDLKLGPHFYITHNEKWSSEVFIYKMTRSDLEVERDATVLSSTTADPVSLDDLKLQENSYRLDYALTFTDGKTEIEGKIAEYAIRKTADKGFRSPYTTRPFLRGMVSRYFDSFYQWKLSAGLHHRSRYSIKDGIFLGLRVMKDPYPFQFVGVLNSGYLTLRPAFRWHHLRFGYGIKVPVNNGEEGLWIPNSHIFHLQASF